MNKSFLKFFKGLSVYSALLLIFGALLFVVFLRHLYMSIFPWVLLFYYVSTLLLHGYMLRITKKDVSHFSLKFMLLSFFKMLIYIMLGVLYIIVNEEGAVVFLVVYLVLYVLYAVFEVRSVMKIINESKV